MIYFTELDHLPVYDVRGHYLGRIVDLGIEPSQDPLRVARYFVRTVERKTLCIPPPREDAIRLGARSAEPCRHQ